MSTKEPVLGTRPVNIETRSVNINTVYPSKSSDFVVNTEHFVRFNIRKAQVQSFSQPTSRLVVDHNHMMHCEVVCLLGVQPPLN